MKDFTSPVSFDPTVETVSARRGIAKKLAEIMALVGYVQKDASNAHHGYGYASAEAVLKKVNKELSGRGIAVSSIAHLVRYEIGPARTNAVVKLTLEFTDSESGESMLVEGLGEGSDKTDKATMKANTAALKYALANAFLISWGDDPEKFDAAEVVDEINATTSAADLTALGERLGRLAASNKIGKRDASKIRTAYEKRLAELGG